MKKWILMIGIGSALLSAQSLEWNNKKMIAQGRNIFANNCAVCHGKNAQGQGDFPSLKAGHITHHSPQKLLKQIANGGKSMPAFKGKLTKKERQSAFVYIHSLWSEKMKKHYQKKFNLKEK